MDSAALLGLSLRIGCTGVLLQSIEVAWHRREIRDDGLLGWTPAQGKHAGGLRGAIGRLNLFPTPLVVLWVRIALAGASLFFPAGLALSAGLFLLVLSQLYYNRRFSVIASESDTMVLFVLAAVWVGTLPGSSSRLRSVALAFLAAQVLLAYVASGFDKVMTRPWRSGAQLKTVFLHSLQRRPPLGRYFERRPGIAAALAWSVILLELCFPLALLLPAPGFWLFVAAGLGFHAAVAFLMGLHGFFWSFAACYPALWFVHERLAGRFGG